jgi:hypothetical protein
MQADRHWLSVTPPYTRGADERVVYAVLPLASLAGLHHYPLS